MRDRPSPDTEGEPRSRAQDIVKRRHHQRARWLWAWVGLGVLLGVAIWWQWLAPDRDADTSRGELSAALGATTPSPYDRPPEILPSPAPEPATPADVSSPPPPAPIADAPEAAPLPPLDESEAIVHEQIASVLSPARLGLLGAAESVEFLRRAVAAVVNVAEGGSPRAHFPEFRPRSAFRVREVDDRVVIDPASYARYDHVAKLVDAVRAEAVASAITTLEPLLDSAYQELGVPDGHFVDALSTAIEELLETPVLEGEVEVESLVGRYAYADPELESLSLAQKQLLRMGPENVERVQAKLEALAAELGLTRLAGRELPGAS